MNEEPIYTSKVGQKLPSGSIKPIISIFHNRIEAFCVNVSKDSIFRKDEWKVFLKRNISNVELVKVSGFLFLFKPEAHIYIHTYDGNKYHCIMFLKPTDVEDIYQAILRNL